jgi:hypothetical protein
MNYKKYFPFLTDVSLARAEQWQKQMQEFVADLIAERPDCTYQDAINLFCILKMGELDAGITASLK